MFNLVYPAKCPTAREQYNSPHERKQNEKLGLALDARPFKVWDDTAEVEGQRAVASQ
jgi:hypothetical protein